MNPIYRFFILRPTANLLDPAMAATGYRLDVTNGRLVPASAQTSDYMPVVPGTEYNTKQSSGVAMQISYIAFYDASRTFISGASDVMSATAPTGAAYARVSFPGGIDLAEWQFAASSVSFSEFVSSRVFPVWKDDVTIDYALQQGEEFYRGTMSGKLTFQMADYDFINESAFDKRFDLKICITYDGGANWADYWRGKFYKTDCDFNDDDRTVIVTPTLDDAYNDVLAGLEKEYDLIKLAPEIEQVRYDKRPMLQYYVSGENVVGCYLSGMWWEQECGQPDDAQALWDAGFSQIINRVTGAFSQSSGASPQLPSFMSFDAPFPFQQSWTMSGGGYVLECIQDSPTYFVFVIYPVGHPSNRLWQGNNDTSVPIPSYTVQLEPVAGSGAVGTVDVKIDLFQIWARIVTDKETAVSVEITADDFVPDIRNYRYAVRPGNELADSVAFSSELSDTPTEWGLYKPGKYYDKPDSMGEYFPLCRSLWQSFSLWVDSGQIPAELDPTYRAQSVLRDAYPIASVISVLLGQFAPGITHEATTDYSRFLYGATDPLTFVSHHLFICPKSNVLTAGYDQPAQQAKITLRAVLDMLRQCFRCYWFIDENKRFRIEHIEFFRRGGSYSLLPSVGIDLTAAKVTRNGNPWAYVRNQYKFDKPEMAERYQFGWMDDVTEQFDGQPIDIVSGYVQPGNIENITPSQFTTDVDYMLLNPGACSKDGFALLSAVVDSDGYVLPYENIAGGLLQNGQLSWPYLQIYYVWDMPARYYKIGSTQYRATGVKKLKTQSLKFPVLREPNLFELVKTDLGNGTIQKLSVNLSSRNATATLKYEYDTE